MLILSRAVRFAINPVDPAAEPAFAGVNGFAGVPSLRGLGCYYELNVQCIGEPDPLTGYLINIKEIDAAVRSALVPRIARACFERPQHEPASLLPELLSLLNEALRTGDATALCWRLTPYYSLEMNAADMHTVLLRQKFDFAASHRLHVESLSEEENRQIFGKCNNPGGHGHNYQFEPCIAMGLDEDGRPGWSLGALEEVVDEVLIQRFDHTHLNLDTREFNTAKGGVNPTVENIARVFFGLLAAALKERGAGVELRSMTVWETDRTGATYPAG